jgi:hypothetical protein
MPGGIPPPGIDVERSISYVYRPSIPLAGRRGPSAGVDEEGGCNGRHRS